MKNYIQPGEHITLTAPAAVSAGDAVLIGDIFGVAQGDAAQDELIVLVRRGVFTLTKTSAQAWTAGAKVYWDAANSVVTTTATGNKMIGAAVETAANPSATGVVLLDGTIR